MKISASSRSVLNSCVALALLAGCGGLQTPIDAPGAMPQISAIATQAGRDKSWMLPEAKSEALLYASNQGDASSEYGDVLVFAYPQGKLVGTLTGFSTFVQSLCSDSSGNVFITAGTTSLSQGYVFEYSHGGTQPVVTLSDPGSPNGCSVDATTGNLAVANVNSTGYYKYYGDVAIFPGAQGTATTYYDSGIINPFYCSYDSDGNLFIDGYSGPSNMLGELPAGGTTFADITLDKYIAPESLQWSDNALIAAGGGGSSNGEEQIYQVAISGSTGTVSGPSLLWGRGDRRPGPVQFWVEGNAIVGPDHTRGGTGLINLWRYPRGGKPIKTLRARGATGFYGVTVSVAK